MQNDSNNSPYFSAYLDEILETALEIFIQCPDAVILLCNLD